MKDVDNQPWEGLSWPGQPSNRTCKGTKRGGKRVEDRETERRAAR